MNFGYTFGRPEQRESSSAEDAGTNQNASSQSQEYSIDVNQITPPTFRFGQFGQAPLPSDPIEAKDNVTGSVDDDSFLAEPSISVGQFDATFTFHSSSDSLEDSVTPTVSTATTTTSVPILIEEPLAQPVYLEEPAPHSVEELLKATFDGNTADVILESWENVGIEEIEAAHAECDAFKEAEAPTEDIEVGEQIKPKPLAEISENEEKAELEQEPVDTVIESKEETVSEIKESNAAGKKVKSPKTTAEPKKLKGTKKVLKASEPKELEPAVVVSGKRERKSVERLADTAITKGSTEKTPAIPKGSGLRLGDIDIINQNLNRKLVSDKYVILLHRLLYDRLGDARQRKSAIKAFCGFESSEATAQIEAKLQKYTNAELKDLLHFLGMTSANDKASLVSKISGFLAKPSTDIVKLSLEKKAAKKAAAAKKKSSTVAVGSRSSKRLAPTAKKVAAPVKRTRTAKPTTFLTPETVDSDSD